MSRNRSKIGVKIPKTNGNRTIPMGHKTLVGSVFADTGLDVFLDGLKRAQGEKVSSEVVALVANSAEMTGISVNRIDRVLQDPDVRAEYGLGGSASKSMYRTVERIGRETDGIVGFLGRVLKRKYGVKMDTVFMDWTSMYFEAAQKGIVRVGYSRDHRPDRPQITVGLSMDRDSGMPVGLTLKPGNVLDVTHFAETFGQVRPLLPDDAMIVFDNGAYSRENAALLDREGMGFVTRMQLNRSDDAFVNAHMDDFVTIEDGISYIMTKGNLGRCRYIIRNEKLRNDVLYRYRRKVQRDYSELSEVRNAVENRKRPRKKYRNSNCFLETRISYSFPLKFSSEEEAVEWGVRRMTTGREGLFVLLTNRPLSAYETLRLYRARNDIETGFRDLKHGIDWRPARCTSPDAIRGRVLISFLALFCMSMVRFLYPEYRGTTAESLSEELGPFSLTLVKQDGFVIRRIWSNFTALIGRISGRERPIPVPKAPGQAVLDGYPGT